MPDDNEASLPDKPDKVLGTDETLALINQQILNLAARAQRGEAFDNTATVDDGFGNQKVVEYRTELGNQFDSLVTARKAIMSTLPNGGVRESLSPNVSAQVAATMRGQDISSATSDKDREAQVRQGDLNREQQAGRDKEAIRANNLKTTLDFLEQNVKTGQLKADEATNRITAATQAANVQRNVMADFGKYALPAGTQSFPTGPLVALAQSMGLPAPEFPTMGTFGLNPGALGDSITGAVGPSAVPGVDSALANAAQMLAGLGIQIPPTLDGRAMRAPSQGVAA